MVCVLLVLKLKIEYILIIGVLVGLLFLRMGWLFLLRVFVFVILLMMGVFGIILLLRGF